MEDNRVGQIRLGSPFGDWLYNRCVKDPSVKTVVEIGTWRGLGSTECFIRGLEDSGKSDVVFYSLEANQQMYETACSAWKTNLPAWAKLVHGRVIEPEEMDRVNLGEGHPDESLWFKQDEDAFLSCPNVINQLPDKIDFLFLDGGEFSTYPEFLKLNPRSTIVGMDDTTSRKCRRIRETVLSAPEAYEVLLDNPWHNNGIMVFKTKN